MRRSHSFLIKVWRRFVAPERTTASVWGKPSMRQRHRARGLAGPTTALVLGLSFVGLAAGGAQPAWADCPAVTVADMKGVAPGKYPQQYELSAFEAAANCKLGFKANPAIADLNGRIQGNPALPELAARLPEEPLVVVPYDAIGHYGGTFHALSNATEAGTSERRSLRGTGASLALRCRTSMTFSPS